MIAFLIKGSIAGVGLSLMSLGLASFVVPTGTIIDYANPAAVMGGGLGFAVALAIVVRDLRHKI